MLGFCWWCSVCYRGDKPAHQKDIRETPQIYICSSFAGQGLLSCVPDWSLTGPGGVFWSVAIAKNNKNIITSLTILLLRSVRRFRGFSPDWAFFITSSVLVAIHVSQPSFIEIDKLVKYWDFPLTHVRNKMQMFQFKWLESTKATMTSLVPVKWVSGAVTSPHPVPLVAHSIH